MSLGYMNDANKHYQLSVYFLCVLHKGKDTLYIHYIFINFFFSRIPSILAEVLASFSSDFTFKLFQVESHYDFLEAQTAIPAPLT